MTRIIGWLVCAAVAVLTARVEAGDWPQWRGPQRTDISEETGLLKEWPAEGPKKLWTFSDAGLGYSSFSIVGNKLFTLGARGNEEFLICINTDSGEEIWSLNVGDLLTNGWGDGPRSTPTVDGAQVFALSGQGNVVSADAETGKEQWRVRLSDFGGRQPNWGYCESVLVDGEKVVCTPGGKQGALLALNRSTGEKIWQSTEFTEPAHYSSIVIAELNNVRQYIQLTPAKLAGINAADGSLIWQSDWQGRTAVIPTPIYHDGHVYITSGYGVGCKLVKINADNTTEDVYVNKVMKNHHGGTIRIGDHVYGYSDGPGWICQDFLTGEMVWNERSALGKGSVTYAEGHLYCLSEQSGEMALIKATPDGYQEVSRFTLEPQSDQRSQRGKIWSHPVISNGRLYLRDQELISCYDIRS